MPVRQSPYNPVVRCHAGKTAGFVLAERHLTSPSDSAESAECGRNRNHAPSRSFRITFYGLTLSGVTTSTPF
jgi:hypothetical protein